MVGSGVFVFRGVGVKVAVDVNVGMAAAVCVDAALAVCAINILIALGSSVGTGAAREGMHPFISARVMIPINDFFAGDAISINHI